MYFRTTVWTLIREARDARGPALDDLVRRYWDPIRKFLRNRGFPEPDAEDLAQEVLIQVCKDDFLRDADAAKGRFRSLLLAVTRNIVSKHLRARHAEKRGGDAAAVPLDDAPAEETAEYNRLWALQIMRAALDRLRADHPAYAGAIDLHYFQEVPYKEVAARLGRKEQDVKNHIFQGKKLLAGFVREIIREYCSSPGEYQDEIDELARYLP